MHRNCTLVIVTLLMSFVLVGSAQAASLPNAGPEGSAAAAIFAGGADTPPVCASPSPQLKSQVIYDCGKATCGTVTVEGWSCLNHPCCVDCSNPTSPIFGCMYSTGCK